MPTITKITVVGINTKSYTANPQYKMDSFESAVEEARNISILNEKIANLIAYLNEFPDTQIQFAVNLIFSPATVAEKTKKGKNKYQYWIPGLYIHTIEEAVIVEPQTEQPC